VDVYEYEFPWIKKGMAADMELSYVPGRQFTGKVLFIYPFLSAKTRTARIRLEFPNPDFELKPDMYANIYLKSTMAEEVLVIPQEAVIDSGLRKVVFIALGKGKFQPREIKLGIEGNHNEYQVLEGLKEGENIVVSAQFMLDSESRLREAIQKMLEVQASQESAAPGNAQDGTKNPNMDMNDIKIDEDDDSDMEGLSMDDMSEQPVKPSRE
jgi:Cu(I)/Ag(I) efflux system membrane fusion protein/cobalt-zinc-cadmium efflux system membrane fusion protein